ncbi:CehA/McbA family metallohydrolase [Sorangium sp. So ce119]|uniref:PHP domain-containing protein n=1 Tax=Sorangium sp. So ce119 TaxID=3133279 RepID=UPI003F5F5624
MRIRERWIACLLVGGAALLGFACWKGSLSAASDAAAGLEGPSGRLRFEKSLDVSVFQRGNIHTHTSLSDGDSEPREVVRWYRQNGYAFVALTDHNHRVDPAMFQGLQASSNFVVIPGEEITMTAEGRPVHVNALCAQGTIGGGNFPTKGEALRWAIERVRAEGGVALINHPNFDWALSAADLLGAPRAELLEIHSGHPYVHTDGDATRPSHEALWDTVLTARGAAGGAIAGVAVDDTHQLVPGSSAPPSGPGRAFIEVFSREVSSAAICSALAWGRLYASTGARLRRIAIADDAFSVWPKAPDATVEFIGAGGRVLEKQRPVAGRATYRLRGGERYVRARITRPDGKRAWTQAYAAVE